MGSSFTQRNPSASCMEQVPPMIGTIKVHATKPEPDPICYQRIKYRARPYLFASLFASLHCGPGDSFFSSLALRQESYSFISIVMSVSLSTRLRRLGYLRLDSTVLTGSSGRCQVFRVSVRSVCQD